MELAKNLTSLCQERGIAIASIARLSGIKQPTLFGWTTGRVVVFSHPPSLKAWVTPRRLTAF